MRAWPGLLAAAALAGCATLDLPFGEHLESAAAPVRSCATWFAVLDAQIEDSGVRDAQETRIAGFPYLRVNRLLSALRGRAGSNEAALQALADRLAALDTAARKAEIANLPDERLAALPDLVLKGSPAEALARTRECARVLREVDLARPAARRLLLERAEVADDYSVAQRIFGLYALTRLPFAGGVKRWQEQARAALASPSRGVVPGVRYAPPASTERPREAIGRMLAALSANPLGLPEPAGEELAELLVAYAPSFEIEVAGDHDRFGRLRWLRGALVPSVDASEQIVYAHAARTLYRGRALLQLVYTIWFPERPEREPGDLYSGVLDGVTWRVTLSPGGEPLVYDTMHPCGCFHMFFPTPRARVLPAPDEIEEWAFAPQVLPQVQPDERPLLRISSVTHYVEGVSLVRGVDSVARYQLQDYEELRSLARLDGGRRSAFGPDGLIAGTERAERFLFWPMGIVSAGAMRQWGRHATAFVGRRHFDDADLFEKRFEFDLR
jgi:hypothetical protein